MKRQLMLRDHRLISKIGHRAAELYKLYGINSEPAIDFMLDIERMECDLDLQALLDADEANFLHDIGGIRRHLNHQTGELQDCFWPRYAV